MGVGSAYLAGCGRSVVDVAPSFVATDLMVADTSLFPAVRLKLVYHFSISLVFCGSPPSALLTVRLVVVKCITALPHRAGRVALRLPAAGAISSVIPVKRLPHHTSPVGAYVGSCRLMVVSPGVRRR